MYEKIMNLKKKRGNGVYIQILSGYYENEN